MSHVVSECFQVPLRQILNIISANLCAPCPRASALIHSKAWWCNPARPEQTLNAMQGLIFRSINPKPPLQKMFWKQHAAITQGNWTSVEIICQTLWHIHILKYYVHGRVIPSYHLNSNKMCMYIYICTYIYIYMYTCVRVCCKSQIDYDNLTNHTMISTDHLMCVSPRLSQTMLVPSCISWQDWPWLARKWTTKQYKTLNWNYLTSIWRPWKSYPICCRVWLPCVHMYIYI